MLTEKPQIGEELLEAVRATIADAGAEYVGIRGSSVLFRDPVSDTVCSLYLFSATRTNIGFALKAARERLSSELHAWEKAGVVR